MPRWTTNDIRNLCATVAVLCQGCGIDMDDGPTALDRERYARRMCGGCIEERRKEPRHG